jgi:hypothetical protein
MELLSGKMGADINDENQNANMWGSLFGAGIGALGSWAGGKA